MTRSAAQPQDLHPSVIIRASAGTGKTFSLAMRYIGLLAREQSPSSLLATTFTKKAAGEMLDRVMKFLASGATSPKMLADLRQHADPLLTHDRCKDLLRLLVKNLHRHNVLNIDKLFLRLASGLSLDLGIAPGWSLIDPQDDDSLRIESLSSMLASRSAQATLEGLIRLTRGGNPSQVHSPILAALKLTYSQFIAASRALEPWQALKPETPPLSAQDLLLAIESLRATENFVPRKKDGEPDLRFVKAIIKSVVNARESDWKSFLGGGICKEVLSGEECRYHKIEVPESICASYRPIIAHALATLRTQLLERNSALHELLRDFDIEYRKSKASHGTFIFDDIPQLLLELPWAGARDHIYYKLDARIRHVLLDEFQDTSLHQYDLLHPLIEECRSSDDGRTFFVVGDIKQSLYGWRGAEPALLDQLDHALGIDPKDVRTLSLNRRSSPVIIDAVNAVFASIADNPACAEKGSLAARRWQNGYQVHEAFNASLPGTVNLLVSPEPPENSEVSASELLLSTTAQRVKAVYDRAPDASIAILLRKNKWIAPLRFELSRLDIESSEEGGSSLTDSPAVCAILSLFHLASHPGDTICRYHIAKSPVGPLVGLTDFRSNRAALRLSCRIRSSILSRGVAPCIHTLRKQLLPALTVRDHARLTQLISQAATFDSTGSRDAAEFHAFATARRVEDPSPARVRIMSIHKAKGLEFDAVFLPQLDRPWQTNGQDLLLQRPSPFDPPALLSMAPASELAEADPEIKAIKQARFETLVGEELCCLYVGMTRAIHHLEILVPPVEPRNGGNPSSARVLCEALAPGRSCEPETTLYARSSGDWAQWQVAQKRAPLPELAPLSLQLAQSTRISPLRLARTSPSALEGSAAPRVTDILQPRAGASLDRGTLIHAWFELIEWSDVAIPCDEALLKHAACLVPDSDDIKASLSEFHTMLRYPEIERALSRPHEPSRKWILKREWPFCVQTSVRDRPTLLAGRFDRVHICFEGDKAVSARILDFKTDGLVNASIQVSIEHYRPQMAAYRSALSSLLKLTPSSIHASLLFVSTGQIVEV